MTHGEVFLQGKRRQAPVSRERSRGSRWAPASMGGLLNPRRAGGSQRHGVSSAPTHMRLLGCSQSQTGWLAPAGPRCLWTPHSLGQIWLRHPSPAAGFGVLWAATKLACGSPTVPEQTDPSSWKRFSLGDLEMGRHVGTGKAGGGPRGNFVFLWASPAQLLPAWENEELADCGQDARF